MEKAVKCTQNVLPDFVQVYSTVLSLIFAISKKFTYSSHNTERDADDIFL